MEQSLRKHFDPYQFDPNNESYQEDIWIASGELLPDELTPEDSKLVNIQSPKQPIITSSKLKSYGLLHSLVSGVHLNQT